MDPLEASAIVFRRMRQFEPQHVTHKIIGCLLMQDKGEELIRLAFGPDALIHSSIQKVKMQLGLVPKPVISPPISPSININSFSDHSVRPFSPISSPQGIRMPNPYLKPQIIPDHHLMVDTKFSLEDFGLQSPNEYFSLDDQRDRSNSVHSPFASDYYYADTPFPRGPRSPSEFPIKTCHYFNKGFCKHGNNCRFFHGNPFPDSFSQMDDFDIEEHILSPGSLEKLELEITELLKMRRGSPVSIASLPMLYYEKYGRTLQAEGYLTESQRHGKAGYSLTKLLARLKNSIRLIDRPHGQHSVILVEDAQKYFESRGDRNDPGPIVSGSRQIYLTFPAESSFTEEDVSDYFSTFGLVQDVRIPCQPKRMFGFVTFASSDTVKMILSKGNPHYVCGARVLVKPYREKSKLIDRKYPDKFDPSLLYGSHYADIDIDFPSSLESPRFLRKPYMTEQESNLEAQIRRLSEMQLARKSFGNHSFLNYSVDEHITPEDHKFPSDERFNYLLDVLNNDSETDNCAKQTDTVQADPESFGAKDDLPESPTSPPIVSTDSTSA